MSSALQRVNPEEHRMRDGVVSGIERRLERLKAARAVIEQKIEANERSLEAAKSAALLNESVVIRKKRPAAEQQPAA
jgi:hypothetical protein